MPKRSYFPKPWALVYLFISFFYLTVFEWVVTVYAQEPIAQAAHLPVVPAQMIYPLAESLVDRSTVEFRWSSGGNVDKNILTIGSAPGQADILNRVFTTPGRAVVDLKATSASEIYVRLSSQVRGEWVHQDYHYWIRKNDRLTVSTNDHPHVIKGVVYINDSLTVFWEPKAVVERYRLQVECVDNQQSLVDKPLAKGSSAEVNINANCHNYRIRLWESIHSVWSVNEYVFDRKRN